MAQIYTNRFVLERN